MPRITVYYKMVVRAGRRRQPRNASADIDLALAATFDVTNPGFATPSYFPQLPYTLPGGSGLAQLVFWNVTDGVTGRVLPPGPLTQAVGANPLIITAWYYPVTGIADGGGEPSILDDAFSANLGRFIDDTFVTV